MRDCAKEKFFMAKASQTLTSLQKLYEKRSALDKQIITAEKKLVSEAKAPAATTKKTTARKTTAKKTTAKKKTATKKTAKK